MVQAVDFIGPLLAVRTVNDQAPRRAGCASGTWLDTPTASIWQQLVDPPGLPYVIRGPAADADRLIEAHRHRPEVGRAGILFIPEELHPMPDHSRHFRIKATQHTPGGHVNVGVWAGTALHAANRSRPKLGQLVMDVDDWLAFIRLITWCPTEVVEVDTDGLLDFDGTGSADADMHLAGFRGYEGCTRGDCRTAGLCSAKGDCLDADPGPVSPAPPLEIPGMLAEETQPGPLVDEPAIEYRLPPDLDRAWITLTGAVTPRPGSTGWALTFFIDDHPRHLETQNWRPGDALVPVGYGGWFSGEPGQAYRLYVRLDGAEWAPTALVPVTLRVSDQETASPWAPAVLRQQRPV